MLTGLSKRLLEIQQEVAHARKTEGEPNQELKRILREEIQPLRHQLQDLEDNLPAQVRQVAASLEPAVSALEGKLGTRHQAAINLTLLQLTSALNQTETRLTATARQQEVLVTEVRADLRDVRTRLAEFGTLLQLLPERMRASGASPLPADTRDSAIPLPDRVESDPGSADTGFRVPELLLDTPDEPVHCGAAGCCARTYKAFPGLDRGRPCRFRNRTR